MTYISMETKCKLNSLYGKYVQDVNNLLKQEEERIKNMKSKKTQENEQQERSYLELQSFELKRVKEAKGGVVFFDAAINGITIYGMKIVPRKDQSGDFVAWPSTKGNDGEYHSTAFAFLRPETEKSIMAAVQEKLDE